MFSILIGRQLEIVKSSLGCPLDIRFSWMLHIYLNEQYLLPKLRSIRFQVLYCRVKNQASPQRFSIWSGRGGVIFKTADFHEINFSCLNRVTCRWNLTASNLELCLLHSKKQFFSEKISYIWGFDLAWSAEELQKSGPLKSHRWYHI